MTSITKVAIYPPIGIARIGNSPTGVVKSSWLRKSDWAPPTAKQSRSQKSCHQLLARIIRRANIGLTLSGCQVAPGIFNLF